MPVKDITGVRFGRLVAVSRENPIKNSRRKSRWKCVCDCGGEKIASIDLLSAGKTSSCGCLRRENANIQSRLNSRAKMSKEAVAKRIEKNSIPEPNSGCWIWTGSVDKRGYGHTAMGAGKTMIASRMSFFAFHEDPTDRVVMHKCDNPICVNPDHLMVGTQKENVADMFSKGRSRPGGKIVAATQKIPKREKASVRPD